MKHLQEFPFVYYWFMKKTSSFFGPFVTYYSPVVKKQTSETFDVYSPWPKRLMSTVQERNVWCLQSLIETFDVYSPWSKRLMCTVPDRNVWCLQSLIERFDVYSPWSKGVYSYNHPGLWTVNSSNLTMFVAGQQLFSKGCKMAAKI